MLPIYFFLCQQPKAETGQPIKTISIPIDMGYLFFIDVYNHISTEPSGYLGIYHILYLKDVESSILFRQ